MEYTLMESIIICIKVMIKMIAIFLHSAMIGMVLIGIGTLIFNYKKILRALRKLSTID